MSKITLHNGDCLEVLRGMPDNSVDAVVTDPPYGLGKEPDALAMLRDWMETGHHDVKSKSGFMGREWDAFVPQPLLWREVLRVLKPGGHVVAFAGSRTYDLMALGLRIAGFEIRDMTAWLHGQGMAKSLNISKALDAAAGAEREVIGEHPYASRKPNGTWTGDVYGEEPSHREGPKLTAPATPEAKAWDGWYSGLKPAIEPAVLARKPLEGTIAANVLKWGTGGLAINPCRVLPSTKGMLPHAVNTLQRAGYEFDNSTAYTGPSLGAPAAYHSPGTTRSCGGAEGRSAPHEASRARTCASLEDFQGDYPVYRHLCDGLARLAQAVGLDAVPEQQCARTHTQTPTREDALASEELDSLLYECMTLLSSLGFSNGSDPDPGPDTERLLHAFEQYSAPFLRSSQSGGPTPSTSDLARRIAQFLIHPAPKTCEETCTMGADSPRQKLLINILLVPYISTNTADVVRKKLTLGGRFPANVCHDGSNEVLSCLPDAPGQQAPVKGTEPSLSANGEAVYGKRDRVAFPLRKQNREGEASADRRYTDKGATNFAPTPGVRREATSAARFWFNSSDEMPSRIMYRPKAGKKDRANSKHPTVKPVNLMRWLCRLITPPGGTILDPFAGSGTTGEAAFEEGFDCILIEREAEYFADIQRRLEGIGAIKPAEDTDLFGDITTLEDLLGDIPA